MVIALSRARGLDSALDIVMLYDRGPGCPLAVLECGRWATLAESLSSLFLCVVSSSHPECNRCEIG